MLLPELIAIEPLTQPVQARIPVPGSKSITNRALVLAALSPHQVELCGALWSEDTQVMVDALKKLGFDLVTRPDSEEPCNRAIAVTGGGGTVPAGGTKEHPLELFVGNAGTAARFLTALVSLGSGYYRLSGVARMHERPQSALFEALGRLGYSLWPTSGRLPVIVRGEGPRPGTCQVSIEASSQFASALLLCAGHGGWEVEVVGENAEESPYVAMTLQLIDRFPSRGSFRIEPDASSGSYFWAAQWLLNRRAATAGSAVEVPHWPNSGWQIDQHFPHYLPLPAELSRERHLGDSIMTAVVLAPFAAHPVRFTDLHRLRLQETERVKALKAELSKCLSFSQPTASYLIEQDESLEIHPCPLKGAAIETYNDHRMAMCFAVLALAVPGITLQQPSCVRKTFPNFFQKLAAPPPAGLGATVLDATHRKAVPIPFHRLLAGEPVGNRTELP